MKLQMFVRLAGLGGALIVTQGADAAYIGMSFVNSDSFFASHPNSEIAAAWNAPGGNDQYTIYRLYANFNSNTPADRVDAVAGNALSPLFVSVVHGTLHNATDDHGGNLNLPSDTTPPSRAWDTFVTIKSLPFGNGVSLSPNFDAQTNGLGGNGNLIGPTTNVAWFVTPDNPQGRAMATAPGQAPAPPGTFRVLLGQFTVTAGGIICGNFLLNVNGFDHLNQFIFCPTPSALSLLCFGGFVGRRRRQ